MKSFLEEEAILNPQILAVIDRIIEACPSVVFGGSIVLNALCLLKRPVSDIDLIISIGDTTTELALSKLLEPPAGLDDLYEDAEECNGERVERIAGQIQGVKICLFKVRFHTFSSFSFGERTMNIQSVNEVIAAKREYAKKLSEKHIGDMKVLDSVLDDLPF